MLKMEKHVVSLDMLPLLTYFYFFIFYKGNNPISGICVVRISLLLCFMITCLLYFG